MTSEKSSGKSEGDFLLAVDARIKTGLALYGIATGLVWYRSHNMSSISSLRKAAGHLVNSIEGLSVIVVEGGGPVAEAWKKEGQRAGIQIIATDAGEWRKECIRRTNDWLWCSGTTE